MLISKPGFAAARAPEAKIAIVVAHGRWSCPWGTITAPVSSPELRGQEPTLLAAGSRAARR